jgi:hypothetical protein
LGSTIWHALVLDIGLVLFYLPYAFCFNLGYDKLRKKIISVTWACDPPGFSFAISVSTPRWNASLRR